MNFKEYITYFESVLNAETPIAPYDDASYLDYAKLNWSRMNRWLKNGKLHAETIEKLQNINEKQTWVLISEPWCGDAAHLVPFIALMSEQNPNITLEIQLRDSGSEIDNYLTNGGKSIPKLIIRNENGQDLHVWGPRPVACQAYFDELKEKEMSFEELKVELQKWYNADKGNAIQEEFGKFL
ncbi:MAG TPA: thioredoxin family protein [Crocinitomicaceae bacterium]|nr:thioredoxin family protein [Crocinitomicaceae bacterium]